MDLADTGDAEYAPPAQRVLAFLVMPLAGLGYMLIFPFLLPFLLLRAALGPALGRRLAPRGRTLRQPAATKRDRAARYGARGTTASAGSRGRSRYARL